MDLHIDNILKDLKNDDFDAYLLTGFTNVEYISGYKPTSFAFCLIKDNPIIYASGMDMELAKNNSPEDFKKIYEKEFPKKTFKRYQENSEMFDKMMREPGYMEEFMSSMFRFIYDNLKNKK